jgi:1,4-alpha-glucan branching enzyme
LALVRLDDAVARSEPVAYEPAGGWRACSWGNDGDLSTWSGPAVAEMAFATRAAELGVLTAGPRASREAVRELLALQASDWPFMVSRGQAVPYARERFEGHRRRLASALDELRDRDEAQLRNLAVDADRSSLLAP